MRLLVILFFIVASSVKGSHNSEIKALSCADRVRLESHGEKLTLLVEGFGDVTHRFYIPALQMVSAESANTLSYQVVFSDFTSSQETEDERSLRLRRVEEIRQRGFDYIDKRTEETRYQALKPNYVVLACPGTFYKSILQHWMAKENPPSVFAEKPLADSLDSAYDILEMLHPFDSHFSAIDSYAYKLKRTPEQAMSDIRWLGGIKEIKFYATEDRSGSDLHSSTPQEFKHRDGAVERENRVTMLSHGAGADFLPHFFAAVRYYLNLGTLRPVDVYAFRYRGVDGDPQKETEVPRETGYFATFGAVDLTGSRVHGQVAVGKGLRVKELGEEWEHNAKRFDLIGNNGREIRFDLRSSGSTAGLALYLEPDGKVVTQTVEEKFPYRALFREILTGTASMNNHRISVEEAVLFRERLNLFTRPIEKANSLAVYDGGMGEPNFRRAPFINDLLIQFAPISVPKVRSGLFLRPVGLQGDAKSTLP